MAVLHMIFGDEDEILQEVLRDISTAVAAGKTKIMLDNSFLHAVVPETTAFSGTELQETIMRQLRKRGYLCSLEKQPGPHFTETVFRAKYPPYSICYFGYKVAVSLEKEQL